MKSKWLWDLEPIPKLASPQAVGTTILSFFFDKNS